MTLQTDVLSVAATTARRALVDDSDSMSFAAALFFELYFKLDYLDARTAAVADIEGAQLL